MNDILDSPEFRLPDELDEELEAQGGATAPEPPPVAVAAPAAGLATAEEVAAADIEFVEVCLTRRCFLVTPCCCLW